MIRVSINVDLNFRLMSEVPQDEETIEKMVRQTLEYYFNGYYGLNSLSIEPIADQEDMPKDLINLD